jgi:hypothetical protein
LIHLETIVLYYITPVTLACLVCTFNNVVCLDRKENTSVILFAHIKHASLWHLGLGIKYAVGISEIAIQEKMNGTGQDGTGWNEIEW